MTTATTTSSLYCPSLTRYERWRTHAVRIGDIGIGGDNPIRVQSMTTTDTMDTQATTAILSQKQHGLLQQQLQYMLQLQNL